MWGGYDVPGLRKVASDALIAAHVFVELYSLPRICIDAHRRRSLAASGERVIVEMNMYQRTVRDAGMERDTLQTQSRSEGARSRRSDCSRSDYLGRPGVPFQAHRDVSERRLLSNRESCPKAWCSRRIG